MGLINNGGGAGGGAISGVTVTGTAAAGQVPVASSSTAGAWGYPPGYEIGYDAITSPVVIASTTEATGTTIINCASHTFDGTLVLCEFFAPQCDTGSVLSSDVVVSLFESSTQIGRLDIFLTPAASNMYVPLVGKLRFTPTAAAHTYTITAFASSTTGSPTLTCGAGGTGVAVAAYCRFTKV